jgi:hypothetical protein
VIETLRARIRLTLHAPAYTRAILVAKLFLPVQIT